MSILESPRVMSGEVRERPRVGTCKYARMTHDPKLGLCELVLAHSFLTELSSKAWAREPCGLAN